MLFIGVKVEGATNYFEKQRTFGTIRAYVWYYLFNSPTVASYIQLLTSCHPKSSVRLAWSPIHTHKRLDEYVQWSSVVHPY
jgi:hypothetical protein